MKRKLLFAALCALIGMSQVKAYTTTDLTNAGWTLVTSLTDNTSNVYVLVDAVSGNYIMSRNNSGISQRPVYKTLADPFLNPGLVWTIESRSDGYALCNAETQYYFQSGPSGRGWETSMASMDEYLSQGSFTFTYGDNKYSLRGVTSAGYVGPWNDDVGTTGASRDGEEVAANKSYSTKIFSIYKMAKATYALKYMQNKPDLTAPVNLSFLVVNPTIYSATKATSAQNNSTGAIGSTGWTAYKADRGNTYYTTGDGNTNLEGWNGSGLNIDYYQLVANLPGGKYKATAYVHATHGTANVYICNQNSGTKAYSDAMGTEYADRSSGYVDIATGISASLGIETRTAISDGESWITADNFRMQGNPYVSTLATGVSHYASITSGLWYSISAPVTGDYYIKASAVTTISYTQTGTDCIDASFSTLSFSAGETKKQSLSSGTLYFKANSDVTITIMPENCTSLITNPGFESTTARTDNLAAGASAAGDDYESSGWKLKQSSAWSSSAVVAYGGTGQVNGVNAPSTDNAGNTGNALGVSVGWGGTNKYQSANAVTLPAGAYKLTVYGYNNYNTSQFQSDNGFVSTSGDEYLSTKTSFTYETWEEDVIEFVLEEATEGKFQVGGTAVSGGSGDNAKVFFDNLTLTYSPFAETSDYTALAAAIAAAEANTLGFEDGEYAPYNNVDALTALATAKAIDPSVANGKNTVQTATTALTGASWTANANDVDAIYNQDFSEGGWDPTAWSSTGWAAKVDDINASNTISKTGKGWRPNSYVTITYGNTGVYAMPLAGNQLYKLTFKYGAWDSWSVPTISVLNAEDGLAATALAGTSTYYQDAMTSQTMYFKTGAAGNYILSMNASYNMVWTDVSLVKAAESEITLSESGAFTPATNTYYQTLKLGRTFPTDKVSTLVLPFAMDATATAAAFDEVYELATVVGERIKFTTADAITAGKPYIVKAKEDAVASASNIMSSTLVSVVTPVTRGTVTFTGTFSPISDMRTITNSYILSGNKIYEVDSEVALKAFRCYFTIPSAAVKAFVVDFDDVDGIQAIDNGQLTIDNDKTEIYNLAGQKMSKLQKGVNIVNGKKLLVK